MFRLFFFYLVLLLCVGAFAFAESPAEKSGRKKEEIIVVYHMYSGLPRDPVWHIKDKSAMRNLRDLFDNLDPAPEEDVPGALFGLGSYTLYDTGNPLAAKNTTPSVMIERDWIKIDRADGETVYYHDATGRIGQWVSKQTAKEKPTPWDEDPNHP